MLMLASQWAAKYFATGSAPDLRTIRSWVQKNEVAGEVIGKQTYVDEKAWLSRSKGTGNELADRILRSLA
jgi:hypothetical protein